MTAINGYLNLLSYFLYYDALALIIPTIYPIVNINEPTSKLSISIYGVIMLIWAYVNSYIANIQNNEIKHKFLNIFLAQSILLHGCIYMNGNITGGYYHFIPYVLVYSYLVCLIPKDKPVLSIKKTVIHIDPVDEVSLSKKQEKTEQTTQTLEPFLEINEEHIHSIIPSTIT